jgi:GST-like protein
MIDLYALTSPNVQKIFLMLEETGLPYNTILVDVWKGEHFKPEFLKINPNAKILAIVVQDGPGGKPGTVIESGAILLYLAEKSGKFLPQEMRARYDAIQWMMVQMTSVGPIFGNSFHFSRFAPAGNDYAKSRFGTEVLRLYELYDKRLGETGAYIGGKDYTIADMAAFPWIRLYESNPKVTVETHPHLARWVKDIAARPAVQRAMEKIGKITSARDAATDEDKDRLFGRGRYARA